LSRLFISHSSKNDDWAIALKDWLVREGWSGADDIFLDLDPDRGIAAGQRWVRTLEDAATRCEAVLFLVSEDWLASKWCADEYQLANRLNKKLFALLIDDARRDAACGLCRRGAQVRRLRRNRQTNEWRFHRTRKRILRQGRLRPRHRGLYRGDSARSKRGRFIGHWWRLP
jgi:hypothetical protein